MSTLCLTQVRRLGWLVYLGFLLAFAGGGADFDPRSHLEAGFEFLGGKLIGHVVVMRHDFAIKWVTGRVPIV